jgi:hypothetical protein
MRYRVGPRNEADTDHGAQALERRDTLSWSKVGGWMLLAGSLVLGILAGYVGLLIFQAKVPEAVQTSMIATEARVYYLASGLGLGFVIYGWSVIGVKIAGRSAMARTRRELAPKSTAS